MASPVMMKNPDNGLIKKGYYGFSWTYLFFGWWVPLIRGELGVAALHLIFSMFTFGLWQIIVSFLYNKQYMTRLISQGYKFVDRPEINMSAAAAIGVDLNLATLREPAPAARRLPL
jgi:hypothetical protein